MNLITKNELIVPNMLKTVFTDSFNMNHLLSKKFDKERGFVLKCENNIHLPDLFNRSDYMGFRIIGLAVEIGPWIRTIVAEPG